MTDYAEEQANEIEALESIYPEEFTLIEASPNHIFQVPISAQSEEVCIYASTVPADIHTYLLNSIPS